LSHFSLTHTNKLYGEYYWSNVLKISRKFYGTLWKYLIDSCSTDLEMGVKAWLNYSQEEI
jgi:hypothetical protein